MTEAAVELKVAGQTYRVVTSASAQELGELAATVERALDEVTPPGRQPSPNSLILAAITLAHELAEERAKRAALERRHRRTLERVVAVIDDLVSTGEPARATVASPFQDAVHGEDEVTAIARRRTTGATSAEKRD